MWSQCPCVSSTDFTPSALHRSSRRSCSLAASSSTASPVCVHRSTNTLFSYGPTTSLWISAPSPCQCNVPADVMAARLRVDRGDDLETEGQRAGDLVAVEREEARRAREPVGGGEVHGIDGAQSELGPDVGGAGEAPVVDGDDVERIPVVAERAPER